MNGRNLFTLKKGGKKEKKVAWDTCQKFSGGIDKKRH